MRFQQNQFTKVSPCASPTGPLPTNRKLRELAICTVALLTGALYEYHHHAPNFLAAGGMQAKLDTLNQIYELNPSFAHVEYG